MNITTNMNTLNLYKFVHGSELEYHWANNGNDRDVVLFVPIYLLRDFNSLFTSNFFDDDSYLCYMRKGYFSFWMSDICDYYNIDICGVFGEDKELKQ